MSAVKGRWTIPLAADGELLLWPYKAWPESPLVPVVPCDEAAIERATEAAMDYDTDIADQNMGWYRNLVRAAFRAAGETP